MKESMWGYWIVVLGISIMSVMVLLQNYTTTSEQDYFLIKEVLEASMYEAVDYGYYRDTGELKIIKEKFVESFLRRFSESTNLNAEQYDIKIYNVVESPPKVSVEITSELGERYFFNSESDDIDDNYSVINDLDAIFEFNN